VGVRARVDTVEGQWKAGRNVESSHEVTSKDLHTPVHLCVCE
jgi:hypothetical protein